MRKPTRTLSLITRHLNGKLRLAMVGDSAFRREPSDQGLALRGCFVLLVSFADNGPGGACNVLDVYSRKQSRVVRSTWGAELGQLSDGADLLLVLAGAMLELQG